MSPTYTSDPHTCFEWVGHWNTGVCSLVSLHPVAEITFCSTDHTYYSYNVAVTVKLLQLFPTSGSVAQCLDDMKQDNHSCSQNDASMPQNDAPHDDRNTAADDAAAVCSSGNTFPFPFPHNLAEETEETSPIDLDADDYDDNTGHAGIQYEFESDDDDDDTVICSDIENYQHGDEVDNIQHDSESVDAAANCDVSATPGRLPIDLVHLFSTTDLILNRLNGPRPFQLDIDYVFKIIERQALTVIMCVSAHCLETPSI